MAIGLFVVAAGLAGGLLDSVAVAGGCATCGCGPVCEPGCGCNACCAPACPPCGAGSAGCGGCIHPLAPIEWVLRFLGGSCGCGGGCPGGCSEETYWGDCGTGCASPCDACGNYVGRGAVHAGPVYGAPAAGCGCAMHTQGAPMQNYVQRTPATPVGRSNGYAHYQPRGQATPTAYYGDPRQARVVSVTEQVGAPAQTPATAARPIRQYQYTR
jgi:hypothetical protein